MIEHLRILHYNLGRQKQVQWSLLNDETLSEFAALAVVEPYLYSDPDTGEGQCGSHERWRPLAPTSRREQTPIQFAYRAMLWINAGVQAVQVPIDSHDIVAATIQTAEGTVLLISAYDPNDRSRMTVQDRDLYGKLALIRQAIDQTQQKHGEDIVILLCSDFNRHDYLWGGQEGVARGRRNEAVPLVHFAQEYGLQSMLPAGTITWHHPGMDSSSTIDVIMASHRLAARLDRCGIHVHDHGSDHLPIVIDFLVELPHRSVQPGRLMCAKADWPRIGQEIKTKLEGLCLPVDPSPAHLDETAEAFMGIVVNVVHAKVPRARPSSYAKRWWTPDLSLLRSSLSSARNRVTTLRRRGEDTSDAWSVSKTTRREYFHQVEQRKREHWKEFLADPSNLWKANRYTRIANQTTGVPALAQGNVIAETEEEKAAMLMTSFFPIPPEPEPSCNSKKKGIEPTGRVPRELPPLTLDEIRTAIFRYNPKKAPGSDEITFEIWRELFQYVHPWIQWLYQASVNLGHLPRPWRHAQIVALKKPGKADYTVPKAYRPISLLPTISKGLEAIVATRLSYLAERHSLLPTNHFGARKQRSSEQALDVLVEKIWDAWRRRRVLSLVTFDVQGAFNGVHPQILAQRLSERRVPAAMVKWIRSFCEDRTGSVVVGRYVSERTRIAHAGIPQGSPLSPMLFIFYNANLVDSLIGPQGGSLGFVDDFTAWRTGVDREETKRKLRSEVLRPATRWSRESGATFEASKTGLIHFDFKRVEEERGSPLRFFGAEIKPQDKIKVLGVILDDKLRMAPHIEKIVERATKKCLAIGRLRGIRPKQVRQLYQTVINATTDYAASTWYARDRPGVREHVARLGRVQRMGAQAVIGAFRTVSSAVLQDEAGLEAVESRLTRKTAEHALRVRALPHDHPLFRIMNGMERRSSRHKSPLFETWSRYHKVIQGTKGLGVTPSVPHAVPPWHDHTDLVTIHDDETGAIQFHQRIAAVSAAQLLFYTDASARNGLAGVAVVRYQPHGNTPGPRIVRQETVGRQKTCTVATAEVYAIRKR